MEDLINDILRPMEDVINACDEPMQATGIYSAVGQIKKELMKLLAGDGEDETAPLLAWFYLGGVNGLAREDAFNMALQRSQSFINARRAAELAELEALVQQWEAGIDRLITHENEAYRRGAEMYIALCIEHLQAIIDKRKEVGDET